MAEYGQDGIEFHAAAAAGSGLPDGGTSGDFLRNSAPGEGAWSGGLNSSDVPFAMNKFNSYLVPSGAGTDPIQFNSGAYFVKCDVSVTDNTIQLSASSLTDIGSEFVVQVSIDGVGNTVTVRGVGGILKIDGVTTTDFELDGIQGETVRFVSDGEFWWLVSHYIPT